MAEFTHFNEQGRAKMVDVGKKEVTRRTAVAGARVLLNPHTFALIRSGISRRAMCWVLLRWPALWAQSGLPTLSLCAIL